jgi:nitrite reductase/ring-hydroxylating ferredoxin subunit
MVDVGSLELYPEGRSVIVRAEGREIGIVRWQDRFYALRNVCPHQSGPLCAGLVHPRLLGADEPGLLRLDESRPVIECPWHGWEFDLRTGRSLSADGERVKTYPVEVEAGRLLVGFGAGRQRSR